MSLGSRRERRNWRREVGFAGAGRRNYGLGMAIATAGLDLSLRARLRRIARRGASSAARGLIGALVGGIPEAGIKQDGILMGIKPESLKVRRIATEMENGRP